MSLYNDKEANINCKYICTKYQEAKCVRQILIDLKGDINCISYNYNNSRKLQHPTFNNELIIQTEKAGNETQIKQLRHRGRLRERLLSNCQTSPSYNGPQ